MKKYFILICTVVLSFFSCVYAGNLVKKVYFSPYPILINDEEYSSEMPILSYQDRTYVALREFSEMVGVEIEFVEETIIIKTNNKEEREFNESIKEEKEENIQENLIEKDEQQVEEKTDIKTQAVYITKTGTKYHIKSNCTKGTYYTTTLDDAKRNGYTMCKKCIN